MSDIQTINNGQIQSSARFYTITIAAGGVYTLNSPFNVCKCMSATDKFQVAWSSQSGETDFAEGWKVRFPDPIPYVQIFNNNSSPLTVTLGLGIGDIDDSSFVVSGTVNTQNEPYTQFGTSAVTIGAGGSVTVQPLGYRYLIIQNTGNSLIKVGGSNGIVIQPSGSMDYSCSASVVVQGTPGDVFTVGRFR